MTGLTEYIASRYSSLGRPLDLAPLTRDFRVSNTLFEYSTTGGRFVVKVVVNPEALFGSQAVADRLEAVGRATWELRRAGLPVEEIVASDETRFVQQYNGQLLRVFAFNTGRAYADRPCDRLRSARALRRFHTEGLACLSAGTRRGIAGSEKAFPLHITAGKLPALRTFLQEQAGAGGVFAQILEQWGVIQAAVERTLAYRRVTADSVCLVHTDFHPRNALFDDELDRVTLIDLDNMIIDWRLPCLGFSILRFGFYQRERTPEALHEAIVAFAAEDLEKPGFLDDLLHAMIYIEIEKVLRILYRVKTTGQYAGFVDNVCPLHLSNIKFLTASTVCA